MSYFDIKGQNALVIGAGGIGSAIALGLAQSGAAVVISDVSKENCDAAAAAIQKAGGTVHTFVADIGDHAQIEKLFAFAKEKFQKLDMLVNAAGINKGAPAVDIEPEMWREVMDHFVNSVFYCCQQAARWMLPQKSGKILNVASMSGVICNGSGGSPYATAKAAVIQLTKYLAFEWIKDGVYVNSISPGMVYTALTSIYFDGNPEMVKATNAQIPLGRIAQPEDMVGPALFLLSPASNYMVGQNLLVDGGYTLC